MEISLGARLALVGFCVLLLGSMFLYYHLENRARRKKTTSKD